VSAPEHDAVIVGSDWWIGHGLPPRGWPARLRARARETVSARFFPAQQNASKLMTYEATFGANGRHLQLIGQKEVRDDPGVDLWADTTTLRVRLHDAAAGAAVVGAGVLTLGVSEFVQLTSSMRVSNATSMGESAQVVGMFGRFFLGALWDTYAPPWLRPSLWRRLATWLGRPRPTV